MHSISQELASPHNAQSNGHAETAVKNMKHLLSKCGTFGEEFQRCLCEWHNSTTTSFLTVQLFFGRKSHSALPTLDKQYRPPSHFPSKIKRRDIKVKAQFNQHAKDLHLSRWDKKCFFGSRCLRNGTLSAQSIYIKQSCRVCVCVCVCALQVG